MDITRSATDRRELWALLIEQYDTLRYVALQLARHPDDAADLVQTTYARALQSLDGFEMRPPGVRPWLIRILRNAFFSQYRVHRRRRETALADDDVMEDRSGGRTHDVDAADFDWDTLDDAVKDAIEQLPAAQRQMLLLRGVEQRSYRDIADSLDIPIGTVMSRLSRARRQVQAQLGKDFF